MKVKHGKNEKNKMFFFALKEINEQDIALDTETLKVWKSWHEENSCSPLNLIQSTIPPTQARSFTYLNRIY